MTKPLKKVPPKKEKELKGIYGEKIDKVVPMQELEQHDFKEDEILEGADNESPFKELLNLISSDDIEVKTVLTENQVTRLQKMGMLYALLETAGDSLPKNSKDYDKRVGNIEKVKDLVDNYSNCFMKLIINKDGLSRKQFIEALHKGSEKAEQSQQQKLQKLLNV